MPFMACRTFSAANKSTKLTKLQHEDGSIRLDVRMAGTACYIRKHMVTATCLRYPINLVTREAQLVWDSKPVTIIRVQHSPSAIAQTSRRIIEDANPCDSTKPREIFVDPKPVCICWHSCEGSSSNVSHSIRFSPSVQALSMIDVYSGCK